MCDVSCPALTLLPPSFPPSLPPSTLSGRPAATSTEFISPSAPALLKGKEDVVFFMPEGEETREGSEGGESGGMCREFGA